MASSLFCLLSANALADFGVVRATTRLANGVYLMDSDISVALGQDALEALEHGVPLIIRVKLEVVEQRRFFWDKRLVRINVRRQLQRHALSKRYLLRNLSTGESKSFTSLAQAVKFLGIIDDFPVVDASLLDEQKNYRLRVKAELEIEALPSPLRPLAYINSFLHESNTWTTWPLLR